MPHLPRPSPGPLARGPSGRVVPRATLRRQAANDPFATAPLAEPLRLAALLTALTLAADAIGIVLGHWHLAGRDLAVLALALAALGAPLLLPRYRHDARIAVTLRCALLLLVFQAAAACLSYLLIALAPPLTDARLVAWDAAIGLDWRVLRARQAALPAWMGGALQAAYDSGLPQILAVVLILGLGGHGDRLRGFMGRYVAVTLAVILLSAPIPAAGAFKHFGPELGLAAPADQWHFEALRDGRLRTLALASMQGLISMPSLHAAMAVLLAHALWRTRWAAPAIALNALMLAATPVLGGHYLVDVLAGVAIALLAIAAMPHPAPPPHRAVPPRPGRRGDTPIHDQTGSPP